MAFIISKDHDQKMMLQKQNDHSKDGGDQVEQQKQSDSITSQLYLKSSPNSEAAAAMDRDLVLRRIRHHKNLRKFKSAFETLLGSSSALQATNMASWLDHEDSFSSP